MSTLTFAVVDTIVIMRRNLLRFARLPQLLIFSTVQPAILLLLFNYVFGGAITAGNYQYIQFLLPGFLVQTVVFGSTQASVGMAEDLSKGIIDRFRSLPMARLAILSGRVTADTVRYGVLILLMIGVGSAIGFRFQNDFLSIFGAVLLCILFGFSLSWIAVYIGISVKSVETASVAGFIWVFPLVFASSLYVPIETMPTWLRIFTEVNPVTVTVNTVRALCLGSPLDASWWQSLVWICGLMLVFLPLAVIRYRNLK